MSDSQNNRAGARTLARSGLNRFYLTKSYHVIVTRTVILWRCKCGLGVRVIAETKPNSPGNDIVEMKLQAAREEEKIRNQILRGYDATRISVRRLLGMSDVPKVKVRVQLRYPNGPRMPSRLQ